MNHLWKENHSSSTNDVLLFGKYEHDRRSSSGTVA